LDRDIKIGEGNNAIAANVQDQQAWNELDAQAASIKDQLVFAKGDTAQQLNIQLDNIRAQGSFLQNRIAVRNKFIDELRVKVEALNIQILPFDERLQKLWQELTEARKQWLEQRQPLDKYCRGDFENLRRVLDAWLLIDGLWPSAFAWAALCSLELQDHEKATAYLQKVEKIPAEAGRQSRFATAQISALTGLVKSKQPGQQGKASKAIEIALRDADRKSGWETYFLVGRYYVDREREMLKAKANFEKALKIKPYCPSARLWLARIQTSSSNEEIRDLKAGTKTLESMWKSTGERSWRIGYFLFEAFHRAGRSADANRMWEKTLELAPTTRHDQIKKDRAALLASTAE
jgi:tetratricopeptide (TPR) repeat protein